MTTQTSTSEPTLLGVIQAPFPKVAHPAFHGNPRLRPPGVEFEWTPEMQMEFARCATDQEYFIKKYIKIVTLPSKISKGGLVTMKPYPYQDDIARKVVANRFVICKLPRQSGKTTIVSAVLLWHALFNRRYSVAIVANKAMNAEKILEAAKMAYEYLPAFLQQGIVRWNARRIELENGSKIVTGATTSASIRGSTFNFVYIDEFCFVHPNLQQKFWTSVVPVISAGDDSKIVITSTPQGLDKFYELWDQSTRGENEYVRVEINWWDQPGRDDAWAKTQLQLLGSQEAFDQEYNTAFLGSNGTLINGRTLADMAINTPVLVTPAGLKVFDKPVKGRTYVVMVDAAHGVHLDYAGVVVVDITELPFRVVATYRNNTVTPLVLPQFVYNVALYFMEALVLVESNDVGQAVASDLRNEYQYENMIMSTVKAKRGTEAGAGFSPQTRLGVRTNKEVKKVGCAALKYLVEGRQLFVRCADLKLELSTFVAKGNSYEAEPGRHDDLAMCLVLFGWLTRQAYFRDEISGADIKAKIIAQAAVQDQFVGDSLIVVHDGTGIPNGTTLEEMRELLGR